jgi:hypothetical protein
MRVTRDDTFLTITGYRAVLVTLNAYFGCAVGEEVVEQGQRIEIDAGQEVMLQPQGDFLCVIL